MPRLKKYLSLILIVAIFVIIPFLAHAEDIKDEAKNRNIILIVIGGLRPDHLGFNGYAYGTSVNIDEIAQNGIYFSNTIAQSCWTLPSVTSILTSRFVSAHQVNAPNKKISDKDVTLAEILKLYGYRTAAFICGGGISAESGLSRWFDRYYYRPGGRIASVSPVDILRPASKWLHKNKKRSFFLFLYTYAAGPASDAGRAANKSPGADIEGLKQHIADYDNDIRQADDFIRSIIEEVKRLRLEGKTIIVLCSDHGIELGRPGWTERPAEPNLYQELIHVPLIIKYPGVETYGRKIGSLVQLVDIAPTVLGILGIPASHSMQGESLVPLIKPEKAVCSTFEDKYAYSEAMHGEWAIINKNGFKLIYSAGRRQLYNLRNDPAEQNDLSAGRMDIQIELMKEFFSWRKQIEAPRGGEWLDLSNDMLEKLRRIGYWP